LILVLVELLLILFAVCFVSCASVSGIVSATSLLT